jgi:hypothetical protein
MRHLERATNNQQRLSKCDNVRMARGWESKSVESQQNEPQPAQVKRALTAEEMERVRKREGLELSRGRVMRELETARSEVHRTALQNALTFLDEEIAKLR